MKSVLLLLFFLFGACAWAQEAEWRTDTPWKYRRKITITNGAAVNLTNHVYRVRLTSANFSFAKAMRDGSDLRIADSTAITLLNFYPLDYDAVAETANVYARVPHTIAAGGTYDIFLYYGNPAAESVANADSVFLLFDDFTALPMLYADLSNAHRNIRTGDTLLTLGAAATWDDVQMREHANILFNVSAADPNRRYLAWYSGVGCAGYPTDPCDADCVFVGQMSAPVINGPWTKEGRLFDDVIDNVNAAEDPFAIQIGDTIYVYVEDKRNPDFIGLRVSGDWGLTWIDRGIVIDSVTALTWFDRDIGSPTVWYEAGFNNDSVFVFVEAYNGTCSPTPGCDGGQIGLAASASPNGPFGLIGTTPAMAMGANGTMDDYAMVVDDITRIGGTYYLTYHGSPGSGWVMGMLTATSIYGPWSRDARALKPDFITNADPQFYFNPLAPGVSTQQIESETYMQRIDLMRRNPDNVWDTTKVRGGYMPRLRITGDSLLLASDVARSSVTIMTKGQSFTQDVLFEMRARFESYGSEPRFSMLLGSGALADANGNTSNWETTYQQSGYGFTFHPTGSARIYRMPATGARAGIGTGYSMASLTTFRTYGLSYESVDDSLKGWENELLKTGAVDATFDAAAKNFGIVQGRNGTQGGNVIIDWILARPFILPEPTNVVAAEQAEATGPGKWLSPTDTSPRGTFRNQIGR